MTKSDDNATADMTAKSDRWTVRGIAPETRRKAADMAAKADKSLGRWLSDLIDHAADMAAPADTPPNIIGELTARLERLERAVFPVAVVATQPTLDPTPIATDAPSPETAPETTLAAPTLAAGAVEAATGTSGTTDALGAAGEPGKRTRLSGEAKAARAAEIRRRRDAGESAVTIAAALGISVATVNRDASGA